MVNLITRFKNRKEDLFYFLFFVLHIFLTLAFDCQVILPTKLYPAFLTDRMRGYVTFSKDPLFTNPPLWLQSFIVCELLFQVPFSAYAALCIYNNSKKYFFPHGLVYTVQVMCSMVPVFFEILFAPHALTVGEKAFLVAFYLPFFIIPLTLFRRITGSVSFHVIEKHRKD